MRQMALLAKTLSKSLLVKTKKVQQLSAYVIMTIAPQNSKH